MHQNAFGGRALRPDQLGELTAFPKALGKGEDKDRQEKRIAKREGWLREGRWIWKE